jgi:hypothetical protein
MVSTELFLLDHNVGYSIHNGGFGVFDYTNKYVYFLSENEVIVI